MGTGKHINIIVIMLIFTSMLISTRFVSTNFSGKNVKLYLFRGRGAIEKMADKLPNIPPALGEIIKHMLSCAKFQGQIKH